MFCDEFRRAFLLISEFRILVNVTPPCDQFLFHISSALLDPGFPGVVLCHDSGVHRNEHKKNYCCLACATDGSLTSLLHEDTPEINALHFNCLIPPGPD